MKNIEYPKLARKDDKRFKVSEEQEAKMLYLKSIGFSARKIGEIMEVPVSTVKYHIFKEATDFYVRQIIFYLKAKQKKSRERCFTMETRPRFQRIDAYTKK